MNDALHSKAVLVIDENLAKGFDGIMGAFRDSGHKLKINVTVMMVRNSDGGVGITAQTAYYPMPKVMTEPSVGMVNEGQLRLDDDVR